MSKVKSVAPSGLSITRKGENFTFKWKIPTKKYGDGQDLQYKTNGKWTDISVGKTTTSKLKKLARTHYIPYSGKKALKRVSFRVRGNTSKYKKKVKKNGKTKEVTISPVMSAWSRKSFKIEKPNKPKATVTVQTWPQVKFNWTVPVKDGDSHWFTEVGYTSVLKKNSPANAKNIDFSTSDGVRYSSTNSSASGSLTVKDDSSQLADGNSYTRWFRVRAKGPRGNTDYVYAKHTYALSNKCVITDYEVIPTSGGYTAKVFFDAPKSSQRPLTQAVVEYSIVTPDADMACPAAASWTQAAEVKTDQTKQKNGSYDYSSGAIFSIDTPVGTDECLFFRVNAEYDNKTTYGDPALVETLNYVLDDPTIVNLSTDSVQHTADIEITGATTVPDAFHVVRYMDDDNPDGFDVAIIAHGQTTVSGIQCPAWTNSPRFGVYAAAPGGCYETTTRADGIGSYAVDPKMKSTLVTQGGSIPAAPANVTANAVMPSGTIRVTWDWSWADADSAELSWADHEDAWESTSEPSTYNVTKMHASAWNISGLETGKKWYIRVRLIDDTGSSIAYGAYSDICVVNLSSAPLVPVLTLSDSIITENGEVTASWVYSSTDGTGQAAATIAEVTTDYILEYTLTQDLTVDDSKTYFTRSGSGTELDPYVYTEVENPVDADLGTYYEVTGSTPGDFVYTEIAQVETAQQITLSAQEQGWHYGETHMLAVKTVSGSGYESDGWSDPVSVIIAEPPTCTISSTSLSTETYTTTDDGGNVVTQTVTALTSMPLTVTVVGAGDTGTTTVAIERAEAFHVDRPDETDYNGFEGETVAVDSHIGEDQFEFDVTDLIGHIDDNANYRLVATVQDALGQSAETEIDFVVLWAHQASAPTASVTIDSANMIAVMTATAPVDADPTDVCDIYRLSIDKPQLIYEGAAFGTTYVDPYPTIGEYGGHRFVTRTANGDVTTSDGSFAWMDTDAQLTSRYNIFEFENGRVVLDLDVEISNAWQKDFKETKYLGGSVQGDWNKAVSRTASVSGTAIPGRDDEVIQAIRRLADNAGICHVRTKDGSSYAADVQVSDKYNYASGIRTYEYSLSITRVQPEELDGMTLAEWQDVNEESES